MNTKNKARKTPIMYASKYGHLELIKLMIEFPFIENDSLLIAAIEGSQIEIADYLISKLKYNPNALFQ